MDNLEDFTTYELNESGGDYEFGCVMLYLAPPNWKEVINMIEEEDLYVEEPGHGLEDEPHVTLLFGLAPDLSDAEVENVISKIKISPVQLQKISTFDNPKYDVVKFDVGGKGLHEANAMLSKLPHTNEHPEYHPHATIAYVKPGLGDKYSKDLEEPIEIMPSKVVYSKADGSKKEYKIKEKS